MATEGHDVTLVCYLLKNQMDAFRAYGLDPRFSLKGLMDIRIRGLRRIARIAQVWLTASKHPRADIFYGRDIYGLSSVAMFGKPLIFEAHTPPRSVEQQRTLGWLFRRRNFCRLVVISTPLMQEFLSLYPHLKATSVLLAHDAADPPPISEEEAAPTNWPGRSGALQLGYVGSLYRGKGADFVASLALDMPQHDFHIVGGTAEEVADLRKSFDAENLHYHGRVDHVLVSAYLSKIDIALFPGQSSVLLRDGTDIGRWTSPMKLFEYMAARKPIIASDVQATSEILSQDINAKLVPASNRVEWRQAIEELASDPVMRSALADQAHADWSRHFTWSQRARSVLQGI